jgi:hypothetical protein
VKKPRKPICGERRKVCDESTGASVMVQPFPTEGVLFANLNLTKPELESRVGQLPGKVRSYKLISVSLGEEGLLQQEGSGPSYQGGCLTLCTCQRVFRAEKRTPKSGWTTGGWPGSPAPSSAGAPGCSTWRRRGGCTPPRQNCGRPCPASFGRPSQRGGIALATCTNSACLHVRGAG